MGLQFVAWRRKIGDSGTSSRPQHELAFLWKLAGGSRVSPLLQVPITAQRLPKSISLICLDLANPCIAFWSLLRWLSLLSTRCNQCIRAVEDKNPAAAAAIIAASRTFVGVEDTHVDRFVAIHGSQRITNTLLWTTNTNMHCVAASS